MASSAVVSGLDRLVEAVEAAEAAAAATATAALSRAPRDGFMCPHPGCHRLFSKRYNQQAHMRIHDGTRPFSCDRCGKAFMWKSSLKSHAKMHAKLEAAAAAAARVPPAAVRAATQAAPHAPLAVASTALRRHGVAKRKASPGRRRTKKAENRPSPAPVVTPPRPRPPPVVPIVAPSAVVAVTGMPLQRPSLPGVQKKTEPLDGMTHTGRRSPDSVSRMDLDAATLLTSFR